MFITLQIIFYWGLRLVLGALIFLAGFGKLLDLAGFVDIIHTYRLNLSKQVAWLVAIFVTIFELTLGLWILSGRDLQTAMLLSITMHAGYGLLMTITLLRGLKLQNCGCFGVFRARPLVWYTPLEDVAMILASYALITY